MGKPPSGHTEVPGKTGKNRRNRKTTNAKFNKKLTLFEKIQNTMENNNETGERTVNMSDLDILNDTTLELELNAELSANRQFKTSKTLILCQKMQRRYLRMKILRKNTMQIRIKMQKPALNLMING